MQHSKPKQYISIHNKTIIEHSISVLLNHPNISRVIVVLSPDDQIFSSLPVASDVRVHTCIGGAERADSVLAGLKYLGDKEDWVLVHDAARPCLTAEDLDKLLDLANKERIGGILAMPVKDTMKRSSSDKYILHTESRENLWHALTPQFFPRQQLILALETALAEHASITDEASAMEYVGNTVKIVEGKPSNLKVTQPDDLLLAEFYLQTGQTYDH
jgi:2-C-methyl-D-erythritol 4-phosphate cytidylyltransferase